MSDLTFEQLRDHFEIRELSHRYAQAVDSGDREAWAAVFTKDAILKAFGSEGVCNYDEILGIPDRQLKRYPKTWHGVQTQTVTLNGDTAEGQVYCIARHIYTDYHNAPGEQPFSMVHDMLIRYKDKYRKELGVWLFCEREFFIDMRQVNQVTLFHGKDPSFQNI